MVDKSFDRYILIPPIHVCPLSIPNPPFIFWMHVHLRPLILINFTKKVVLWGIHEDFLCVRNIDRRGGSDPLVFFVSMGYPNTVDIRNAPVN